MIEHGPALPRCIWKHSDHFQSPGTKVSEKGAFCFQVGPAGNPEGGEDTRGVTQAPCSQGSISRRESTEEDKATSPLEEGGWETLSLPYAEVLKNG